MSATVSIKMEVTINGKVYTANGTVEVSEDYFEEWSRMQWPVAAKAAQLAETLQDKVEKRDYSFTAESRH